MNGKRKEEKDLITTCYSLKEKFAFANWNLIGALKTPLTIQQILVFFIFTIGDRPILNQYKVSKAAIPEVFGQCDILLGKSHHWKPMLDKVFSDSHQYLINKTFETSRC